MSDIIFCSIIYIFLLFILLWNCKFQFAQSSDNCISRLNALRGIFAIEVVIGHCVRYDVSYLSPLGNFMIISVGFFFFVSGFGLAKSAATKHDYISSFFKNRFLRLVYIAVIALVLTTAIAFISPVKTYLTDVSFSPKGLFAFPFIRTNWYIRELLVLYLCFYLTYKYFTKHRLLIISILCCSLDALLYFAGYTRCWYASILCFPLGILVYDNYPSVFLFINSIRGRILSLVMLLIAFAFSPLTRMINSSINISIKVSELIFSFGNNLLCIAFILILLQLLTYISFNNILLQTLGKYSTELFVMQFVFVIIAEKMQLSYNWKIAFVIILDLLISICFHRVFTLFPRQRKA